MSGVLVITWRGMSLWKLSCLPKIYLWPDLSIQFTGESQPSPEITEITELKITEITLHENWNYSPCKQTILSDTWCFFLLKMNNSAGLEFGILVHSPYYSGSCPWPAMGHMIYDFRAHAQKKEIFSSSCWCSWWNCTIRKTIRLNLPGVIILTFFISSPKVWWHDQKSAFLIDWGHCRK